MFQPADLVRDQYERTPPTWKASAPSPATCLVRHAHATRRKIISLRHAFNLPRGAIDLLRMAFLTASADIPYIRSWEKGFDLPTSCRRPRRLSISVAQLKSAEDYRAKQFPAVIEAAPVNGWRVLPRRISIDPPYNIPTGFGCEPISSRLFVCGYADCDMASIYRCDAFPFWFACRVLPGAALSALARSQNRTAHAFPVPLYIGIRTSSRRALAKSSNKPSRKTIDGPEKVNSPTCTTVQLTPIIAMLILARRRRCKCSVQERTSATFLALRTDISLRRLGKNAFSALWRLQLKKRVIRTVLQANFLPGLRY